MKLAKSSISQSFVIPELLFPKVLFRRVTDPLAESPGVMKRIAAVNGRSPAGCYLRSGWIMSSSGTITDTGMSLLKGALWT